MKKQVSLLLMAFMGVCLVLGGCGRSTFELKSTGHSDSGKKSGNRHFTVEPDLNCGKRERKVKRDDNRQADSYSMLASV